jgi:restriction endonuclease Mrr
MARSTESDGFLGCLVLALGVICVPEVSGWVSRKFGLNGWLGFAIVVAIVACVLFAMQFIAVSKAKIQAWRTNRKRMAHEEWLRTPQGQAWQCEESERLKKQKEEADRRYEEAKDRAARQEWRQYHESKTMDEISRMGGREFEEFLARLFSRMGYQQITLTATNDQGGDLVCRTPAGSPIVIQAKRWSCSVGNGSVQEVLGAMRYYDCTEGMVVTNSVFTDSARELANKAGIALRDREWLQQQIKTYLPREIPEFSWDEYKKIVKDYQAELTLAVSQFKVRRSKRRRW